MSFLRSILLPSNRSKSCAAPESAVNHIRTIFLFFFFEMHSLCTCTLESKEANGPPAGCLRSSVRAEGNAAEVLASQS